MVTCWKNKLITALRLIFWFNLALYKVILKLLDFSQSDASCLEDAELVSDVKPILKPFKVSISFLWPGYLRLHSPAKLDISPPLSPPHQLQWFG